MNQHISRHPLLLSLLPLLFTWLLLALAQPRQLQNDDLQIFFQYCNGGTGAIPFSFYSGYLTGLLLQGLNYLYDGLNWHLILLQISGSLACGGLNFFAVKRILSTPSGSRNLDYVRLLSALAFLLFFNYKCILFAQYTYIGILNACAALFLLYDWSLGTRGAFKYSFTVLLFICAFEMRNQSIVPFFLLGLFVLWVVVTTSDKEAKKRFIRGGMIFPALLAILLAIHTSAFKAEPAWQQAMQYNTARGMIHDSRDNSGVDKTPGLQQLGISSQDYRIFKSFTYLPGFCEEKADILEKVQELHQDQRKGLFGLDFAAEHGLLALGDYQYKEGSTPAQSISPWLPLITALILVLVGVNRKCTAYAFPVLVALIVYFCLLFSMERVVGRVFHPVLYASAIWLFLGTALCQRSHEKQTHLHRSSLSRNHGSPVLSQRCQAPVQSEGTALENLCAESAEPLSDHKHAAPRHLSPGMEGGEPALFCHDQHAPHCRRLVLLQPRLPCSPACTWHQKPLR